MRSVGPCTPQRTPPHRAAVIYLEKEGGCGPSFHVPAASPPLHLGALAQHCHPPPPLLCHPGHARGCSAAPLTLAAPASALWGALESHQPRFPVRIFLDFRYVLSSPERGGDFFSGKGSLFGEWPKQSCTVRPPVPGCALGAKCGPAGVSAQGKCFPSQAAAVDHEPATGWAAVTLPTYRRLRRLNTELMTRPAVIRPRLTI